MSETFLRILLQKVDEIKLIADSIGDERTSESLDELEAAIRTMENDIRSKAGNVEVCDCAL